MIKSKLITCLSAMMILSWVVKAEAGGLNPKFQILPKPQKIELRSGKGLSWQDISYISTDGSEMPVLGEMLNGLPQSKMQGRGVVLILTEKGVPQSLEGYTMEISNDGVKIQSRSQAGLFYGCMTLEQLMKDSKEQKISIPSLIITDYPDIAFRAVHLDTKHHLDNIEYYYSLIDKLASYKVNGIIWEIEDKLRFNSHPEIAAPNAISSQEMQSLCRYAKERNIDINPLVQGLGHAGFILKRHWELRENQASDWEFCPSDERTYQLQFDLYRDAIEAMPYGKYLHIGGDEITEIGIDERCKKTGKSAFELQMVWLKRVCDFAMANGRIPIFWDDMPLKYANLWWVLHGGLKDEEVEKNWKTDKLDEAIELFPKDCIYMRWHYEDPTILPHLKVLDWYKHKGLQVMAATAASDGGCPFMPRDDSRALNIKNFSRLVIENNLVGILATAWDDGSPHLETVIRGFIAQAEYGWNPNGRGVDEFKSAHAQREFGFTNGELGFLDKLEKVAFYFDNALVEKGRRNPAWQVTSYTLIDIPDKDNPGAWSVKYASKIDSARIMDRQYENIAQELDIAKKNAKRNRYTLDIYEQNNELFNYPVKLILALNEYDLAKDEKNRNNAIKKIKDVCGGFFLMRKKLEEVYSKTRFMEQSQGYLSDMNHHNHLSALSLNSDWLYLYEIPYTKSIMEWIDK